MHTKLSADYKAIAASLFIWILLLGCYSYSLSHHFYSRIFDYIVYIVQLGFDLAIFLSAYRAYKNRSLECDYIFYLLLFFSILPGLLANESYNFLINILDLQSISKEISLFWSVTYTLFLVFQIGVWFYLLRAKLQKPDGLSVEWLLYLPYIQSVFVIFLSLISLKFVRGTILHDLGLTGAINSLLETIWYGVMVFCLARTKNKSLIIIEFGFLMLIAFNLAHLFSYLSGEIYKLFNVLWMLSLIVITYGLVLSSRFSNERIEFFVRNSIHVLAGSVLIVLANIVLLAFMGFDLLISMLETKRIGGLEIIIINTPAVLVLLHSIILFSAKMLTNFISGPLENMVLEIDRIDSGKSNIEIAKSNSLNIYEVEKFNEFVVKTINELQSANKVKSDFLMNMSHDFRTPASGIYNMARSISKRLDNSSVKQHMQLIVDSSDQLLASLESILDYSRLDIGKYAIDQDDSDVRDIVNEIVALLLPKAVDKGVKVEVVHYTSNNLLVSGRVLIHRALLNVISNAIKFTWRGSVKIISSTYSSNKSSWLTIRVKDTGIGIDPIHHQSIFEPFFRVQQSNLLSDGGVGLGLSNAKLMLQNIGGKIEIFSKPGCGSEFTIFIPATSVNYPTFDENRA